MALLTDCGIAGFSVLYPDLHRDGLKSPRHAAELLFALEESGWLRILRWSEADQRYRAASKRSRQDFLSAHENVKPRWDPDVDYAEANLHFELTNKGKAEFLRRRGPTKPNDAWKAEGGDGELFVWATNEANARRFARRLVRHYVVPEGHRVAFRRQDVEPAEFELSTGERFDGVRVTFRLRFAEADAN